MPPANSAAKSTDVANESTKKPSRARRRRRAPSAPASAATSAPAISQDASSNQTGESTSGVRLQSEKKPTSAAKKPGARSEKPSPLSAPKRPKKSKRATTTRSSAPTTAATSKGEAVAQSTTGEKTAAKKVAGAKTGGSGASKTVLSGVVSINPRGFGFVSAGEEDAFISPQLLREGHLLDGDEVIAKIRTVDERSSVVAFKSVRRSRTKLFGVVEMINGESWLRVDPWVSNSPWRLAGSDLVAGEAVGGVIVGNHVVEVTNRFGNPRELDALYARALWRARVAEAAGPKAPKVHAKGSLARKDLRKLVTFTIDGPDSRDLDDALSIERLANGVLRLYVHVADVSDKVAVGSENDRRASKIATSVYLPGRVVTMVDEALSFDTCSLLEGVERDVMTVQMDVTSSGEIEGSEIYAAKIISRAKLTYEQVAAQLRGEERICGFDVARGVDLSHVVATRLGALRASRGGLSVKRFEPVRVTLKDGVLATTQPDGADVAHDLIEEAMVAANETVAKWLSERDLPAVFRRHSAPDATAAEALESFADGLGVVAVLGEELTPRSVAAFERQLAERGVADDGLWEVLVGKLGRASYTARPGSHFGLASEAYVHFTSPIRRYADLVVHRVVKGALMKKRGEVFSEQYLDTLCAHLDEQNERASKAERYATNLIWLKWMGEHRPVGTEMRGRVVRVGKRGALVRLDGVGVSGWVALAGTGPVVVSLDTMRVSRGSASYYVGQVVVVKVSALDLESGMIELEPVRAESVRVEAKAVAKATPKPGQPASTKAHAATSKRTGGSGK